MTNSPISSGSNLKNRIYKYALLFAFIITGACQNPQLPPKTDPSSPAILDSKEEMLNQQAREEFKQIRASGLLSRNPGLQNYLHKIAKTVLPEDVRQTVPFQFYVIDQPDPNAFAFPNGTIVFHTGLIARLENEAQLAMILAHEAIHVEFRHMREHLANMEQHTAGLRMLSILASPMGQIGRIGYELGRLGTIAAINGFGRDLERESDQKGFQYLLKSPYEAREAPRVFELLNLQLDKELERPPYLYASHPRNRERRNTLEQLIRDHPPEKTNGRLFKNRFLNKTRSIKIRNIRSNIERYWPRTARFVLKSLDRNIQNSPGLLFLKAKSYLAESPPEQKKAYNLLRKLEKRRFDNPEFLFVYGRLLKERGNEQKGNELLRRYLQQVPDSPSAPVIRSFLSNK